jgi:hypothetical protein
MPDFQDVSTVISMVPVAINENKPGLIPGSYHIPPCLDPSNDFNIIHIARAKFAVYIDEARPALIVPEPSDRVAESICRDLKISWGHFVPDISEPALFWIPGPHRKQDLQQPKDARILDEFDKRRRMQTEWFKKLVNEADDDWNKHHARRMVSDVARAAAKALGLKKDWDIMNEINVALSVCKFCRGEVDPKAIICKHCTGVLDVARYDKEFVKATK